MNTRRYCSRKNRTKKMFGSKNWGGKTGKKWTSSIKSAKKTLSKTGSIRASKSSLTKHAITNTRKLFGSVGGI